MKAIQIISQDLFDKIRSRFDNLEMGNENGAVTIDPAEARFFDFDFIQEGVLLGRVSISLNDPGSLKVYYSREITEGIDSDVKIQWFSFLKEMRFFAMRRLLRFDTRDIAKSNLDRNDFEFLANKGKKEKNNMSMTESKWHRKTSKTSRAVKGATEVIVRHHDSMEEMAPGLRSHPKRIKAIFIQNREGERYKYPFIHTAGAFAMAQHVDHGGVPHDSGGKAIIRMSEEIAKLAEFAKKIKTPTLNSEAMGIAERAVGRLNELKKQMANLSKRRYYEQWIAELQEPEDDGLMTELDPVTMEQYKSKFTQSSFNEDLVEFFPLIHSIMQEKIDLEEYVNEEEGKFKVSCSQCGEEFMRDKKEGFSHCKDHTGMKSLDENESTNQFEKFVEWAEAMENGDLTDDQKEELKTALDNIETSGPKLELNTAYDFFADFGLTDKDLEQKFETAKNEFDDMDPMDVFKSWAKENGKEDLLSYLGIEDEEAGAEPAAAPAEPAAAPAPTQPVAENSQEKMIEKISEIIKSRFNLSNENVAPFNGREGILLDVEKSCKEEFGDSISEEMLGKIRDLAERYMDKLSDMWERKHGKTAPGNDELSRIKHLSKIQDGRGYSEESNNIQGVEEMLSSLQKSELLNTLKDKWRGGSLDQTIQDTLDSLYAGHFIDRSQRQDAEDFLYSVSDRLFGTDSDDDDISGDEDFMLGLKHDNSRPRFDENLERIKKLSGLAK